MPLVGISIDAEISGPCARVAVAHRYSNREATPIEAVYAFPLDEGAAVCGFEAVVDGTLVVGEVQEREKAFESYDDAMEQGHGAFLLDEERPDVFQASVGNLPPGKDVLVRIVYVTELSIDDGRLRFTIPTTVSPRYAPAEDRTGTGRPDSEALNPPVAWKVPYGLDLSVRVSMPGRITAIESPSHPVSVALGDGAATVTLARMQAALDRDFVLSIDAAGMDAPQAWIERTDDGAEAIAVALVPRFSVAASPAEIIFVVDRSGSMGGSSIDEVRRALQLCLRSMIPGCRFNIVGFGSTYQSLFPASRAYEQATLSEAAAHVAALDADLGGTEILPALTFALQQPPHPDLARKVVVLTDGEVTNTDAVLALVKRHSTDTRLFTLGIGAGPSHHLVRGMARAGRGSAEFIHPDERIEPHVVRLFGRLLSPAITDGKLEWIGGRVIQAPAEVPPVFAGSRLLVYGFAEARPTAVRLSGTGPSGPLSFEIRLDSASVASGRAIATLAARARIRELEEGSEWLSGRGSRQKGRREGSVRQQIIDLSVRHGLISRETSFVAIERRDTPVQGDVQLRRVPIALTSGWGALAEHARFLKAAPQWAAVADVSTCLARSSPHERRWNGVDESLAMSAEPAGRHQMTPSFELRRFDRDAPARLVTARPTQPPRGMDDLVALQAADGSWALTADLASIIGRSLAELEAALAGSTGSPDEIRRAWATALALAWLETRAAGVAGEWSMLAIKARRWIDGVAAAPSSGSAWVDAARQILEGR